MQINYNIRSLVYHTVDVPFGLKSTGSSPKLTMRVFNERDDTVTMYWVNYSGGTRSYGTISPGGNWAVTTYGTHPWLIVDSSDEIVGIYIPYTSAGDTDITLK